VKYELILVRYGEIGLKAKETRKRFEDALVNNIKTALNKEHISNRIKKEWGRIYVYTNQINESLAVLQKIFGITSISPAVQTQSDMDFVSKLAVTFSKEVLNKEKSFALRVTRTGDHEFTSQDVAIKIGSDIVKETKAFVNLTKPDFKLFIEIRDKNAYIFTEKIRGSGGLPLGTQGKIMALIDNPKSILASWYLMRRGCKIIFINTKKSNTEALSSFTSNWYADSDISIFNSGKDIYENLNKIASERKCDAVVTGYSLGDSQHKLSDIKLFKKHIALPILCPLIAMDQDEISKKCKEIGVKI
jgi:thiamine biosynthesis protein ThiI